jgi:hypothetical protein
MVAAVPLYIGVNNAGGAEAYSLYRDRPDVPTLKKGGVAERQYTVVLTVHFGALGLMHRTSNAEWSVLRENN